MNNEFYSFADISGCLLKYPQTACERCKTELSSAPVIKTIFSGVCCAAPFYYEGDVRQAIHHFKFRGAKFNAESFSEEIARAVRSAGFCMDEVTYVPTSFSSRWKRGFDQSDVIARKAAKILDVPFFPLIRKTGKNKVQHELSPEERRKNVIGVYTAVMPEETRNKSILLIDDICTTGSTLSECSKVLLSAGAKEVNCASIAIVRK